jgi:SAM-dependent methyltransferase
MRLARELWEFLRDSAPDRKRQRYADVDYDWDYRVDTTGATVGWQDRLLGVFHSAYQPTEPAFFREMIESLPIQPPHFTFIDLGSGKGRALLMASEYPFRKVVGVELLPKLHRIAEQNIEHFPRERQQCRAVMSQCGDATEFKFPDGPLVLYLFHPLPEAGLAKVMGNLDRSLQAHPRPVWIVYHNPLLEKVLAGSSTIQHVSGNAWYVIYASKQERAAGV